MPSYAEPAATDKETVHRILEGYEHGYTILPRHGGPTRHIVTVKGLSDADGRPIVGTGKSAEHAATVARSKAEKLRNPTPEGSD